MTMPSTISGDDPPRLAIPERGVVDDAVELPHRVRLRRDPMHAFQAREVADHDGRAGQRGARVGGTSFIPRVQQRLVSAARELLRRHQAKTI
jgi:hypothetical protein